jgi:hypothetical protein
MGEDMRVSKTLSLAVAAASVLWTVQSHAAVIINDNFDSYADQAAFQAAWPAAGTTTTTSLQSAQLSTAQSASPSQSVFVPVSTTAAATATEYRNRRSFTDIAALTTSTQLVWSFDFYDSNAAAAPQRNYSNLQDTTAPGLTNQLISLGLNNTQSSIQSGGNYYMARILGYTVAAADPDGGAAESVTGAGIYFKLNDFAVGLRSTGWHNLKTIITSDDGVATDYAFYVDGVLAEKVSNVGGAGTLRQYDNIAIGSGLTNGGVNAYFDNQFLEASAIPEPASLGLIGLAGLFLGRRRRA